MGMFDPVPFQVGGRILETEVGGEIHHPFRKPLQLPEFLHGLGMRKGDEEEVRFLEVLDGAEREGGPFPEVGVNPRHRFAGIPLRSHLMDLYMGVIEEKPEQLPAAITGCADDADFHFLPTSST